MQLVFVRLVQTVSETVLVILGANHFEGIFIIDLFPLFFECVNAFDGKLANKSDVASTLEMRHVTVSKYKKDSLQIDLRDVTNKVNN